MHGVGSNPAWITIAADGDRFVGTTRMTLNADTGSMYITFTGVDPEYRGRGIALALKLLAVEKARQLGVRYLRTNNDSQNAPMLAVNQKLGYVPQPGLYVLLKDL